MSQLPYTLNTVLIITGDDDFVLTVTRVWTSAESYESGTSNRKKKKKIEKPGKLTIIVTLLYPRGNDSHAMMISESDVNSVTGITSYVNSVLV